MSSIYLRFAAPLQSWAGSRVTGNVVRTQPLPTASGIRGFLAACLGAQRGHWPDWLDDVSMVVRTDSAGAIVDEFQTINPRLEDSDYQDSMFMVMTGKKRPKSAHFTPDAQAKTSIVRRTYLADAEFLVELTSETHFFEIVEALKHPKFTPYLGRKGFAPTFPLILGVGESGLLKELPTMNRASNRRWGTTSGSSKSLQITTLSPDIGSQYLDVAVLGRKVWLEEVSKLLRI